MNFKHIETGELKNESLNNSEKNMLIFKSESNKNILDIGLWDLLITSMICPISMT